MEQHSQLLVPDELEAPTCRKVTLKLNILKINRFFCGPKFLHSGQGEMMVSLALSAWVSFSVDNCRAQVPRPQRYRARS